MKKIASFFSTVAIVAIISIGSLKAQTMNVDAKASSVKWLGKKVTGEHNGAIMVAPKSTLVLKDGNLVGGKIMIDMASMTCEDLKDASYNKKLMDHLKSDDFFSVEKFKTATLEITKVVKLKDATNGTHSITGNLTIKGKTQEVTFPATVKMENNQFIGSGKITIDRSKFDVRYGSKSFFDNLGDKMIYDDFYLDVNIVATK